MNLRCLRWYLPVSALALVVATAANWIAYAIWGYWVEWYWLPVFAIVWPMIAVHIFS